MPMNRSEIKYRNSHVAYVKELFKDVPKAAGRLVAISNGGYHTFAQPKFGFRIYFDEKTEMFNCQVYSEVRHKLSEVDTEAKKEELLSEYSVKQVDSNTTLDTVINAILYNEYHIRAWTEELRRRKREGHIAV